MKNTIYSGILLFLGLVAQAQNLTPSQNYVYSRVMLEAVDKDNTTELQSKRQQQSVTYFDGMGRPIQSISIKATPGSKDLVTPVEYDGFGRQVKDFLPLPQLNAVSTNGGYYNTFDSNTNDIEDLYGATVLHSTKQLEASPLSRVLSQGAPGVWQDHPVNYSYGLNNASIRKFIATRDYLTNTSGGITIGSYAVSDLYVNTVADEDGSPTFEYKNAKGQVIMIRKQIAPGDPITVPRPKPALYADTYYVYNSYDQLAYVIPPKAMGEIGGATVNSTILNNLCYQYIYDNRNRLVEKKLPGKGWEYMVYDRLDRLVATQDVEMRKREDWLFTKYDKFGRVVYTGITGDAGSRSDVQGWVEGMFPNNYEESGSFSQEGLTVEYSNATAYPTYIRQLLTVNYYDTYPSGTPAWSSIASPAQTVVTHDVSTDVNTKGMPTASFVKIIGASDDRWDKTYMWYDAKLRPVGTYTLNHLGGFTRTENRPDFSGAPQEVYTQHSRATTASTEVSIKERFVYDGQNRLLKHYHNVNNAPVDELLTDNVYDELGRLTNRKVGATATLGSTAGVLSQPLQDMAYTYNALGWMTGINKASITTLGGKLFAYEIKYDNPTDGSLNPPRYNGNISEVDWNTGGMGKKRYGYNYDGINRLLSARYRIPGVTLPQLGMYDEELGYDVNGNITTLKRSAPNNNIFNPTAEIIDDLSYSYAGNRVTSISDVSGNPTGYEGGGQSISYDDNGSMTAMPDKEISAIGYNYLALPESMNLPGSQTLKYSYMADGRKVLKSLKVPVRGGHSTITTFYLDGFHYKMEQDDLGTISTGRSASAFEETVFVGSEASVVRSQLVTPSLLFFPTAEGFYDYENSKYIYQYKDHLGNVRVSFTKGTNGSAEVTDRNDYYAFGMNQKPSDLTAPTYAIGGEYTNYKYNGKELQENGTYDYGARFYMSDLGRWFAVDPLAEVSRRWSPYAYAYNNPVRFIDPDGMKNVSATSSIDDDDIEIDTGYRTVTKKTAVFGTGGMSGRLSEKGALKMANNIIAQMENGGKDKIIAGIYGAGPKSQSNNPEFEKLIKSMGGTLFKSSIGGGDNEIIEYLKQGYEEGKLISIYGYSRGGNAAVRITNKLGELNIPVYNLVTFDAHSITGGTFELQYNNVTYAANFYQQNPRTWANGYLLTRGILPFGVNPYIGSPVHSKYINVFQVNYTNKNITGKPVNHFNIIDSALYKNIFHPEIKR